MEYLDTHLVPDQREKIFNEESILLLIHAIFSKSNPEWKSDNATNLPALSDIRLFNLAILISNECLNKSSNLINPKIRLLTKNFLLDPSRLRLLYLLIE